MLELADFSLRTAEYPGLLFGTVIGKLNFLAHLGIKFSEPGDFKRVLSTQTLSAPGQRLLGPLELSAELFDLL